MAAKWGVFLCDCQKTLALEPRHLAVPDAWVRTGSQPEAEAEAFAEQAVREGCDRVLIGCCADPNRFEDAFRQTPGRPPSLHVLNLKDACFHVHPQPDEAHAKASRLVRAAMQAAEVQTEASYHPLRAGERLLIVTDTPLALELATRLRQVARPTFVLTADVPGFAAPAWRVVRGEVQAVNGRLGDFRVQLVPEAGAEAPRELQADQVVLLTDQPLPAVKRRTGCHGVHPPRADGLDDLAGRIQDLMGDFLKTVHVTYQADICAGGSSGQPACGVCIPACPYDAIQRDAENPLRMAVDHLACEGCGACVSACPTSALRFTEPSPRELYARLAALLAPLPAVEATTPPLVLFHCGEYGNRCLDAAAQQPRPYPANVLPIGVPCLRYVSEANILAAFHLGAAGVGLLGCEACQHGERDLLFQKLEFATLTLDAFALGGDRLRLFTAADGTEAEAMGALSRFAEGLAPLPWSPNGQALRQTGNRQVIAESLAGFLAHTDRAPGRRPVSAAQPFAFADVNAAGCTLCRSCVNVCPVHAFRLDEASSSLQYQHLACVACGLCEAVCPEHVIRLRHEVYFDADALTYQTVVDDEMVPCSRCGTPYINRRALEAVEARVLSLDTLLDTFAGARRTLLRMCPDCRAVAAMLEVEKGWEP